MDDITLRRDGLDESPPIMDDGGDLAAAGARRRKPAARTAGQAAGRAAGRQQRARSGATRSPRAIPAEPAPPELVPPKSVPLKSAPPEPAAVTPGPGRAEARARNAAAALALDALNRLLERALATAGAPVGCEAAAGSVLAPFTAERPQPPAAPATAPAPDPDDPPYRPALGLLGRLLPGLRRARTERAEEVFRRDYKAWADAVERVERDHAGAVRRHAERLAAWEAGRRAHAEAVRRLCARVLAPRPDDPACLLHAFEVGHDAGAGVTVIDYRLPRPEDLPALKRVRHVQARDAIEEVRLKPDELNRLYDAVVCQLALRALHHLFEADPAGALGAIVFNGWVEATGDAGAAGAGGRGPASRACVLSVRAERRAFRALDLTRADPWACYRALDGVGGARPHRLVPVAPLATLANEDEGRHTPPADGVDHHRPPADRARARPAAEESAARLALAAT